MKLRDRKEGRTDAEALALLAFRAALEKKAEDIVVLDLRKLSSITDFFLICTGGSPRQMEAIVEAIDERLAETGAEALSREGIGEANWVLLDYNDLVVHVFSGEARKFYSLERLWARAPRPSQLAGVTLDELADEQAPSQTGSAS